MKTLEKNVSVRDNEKKTSISEAVLDVNVVFDHEKLEEGLREWLWLNSFYQRAINDKEKIMIKQRGNIVDFSGKHDIEDYLDIVLYCLRDSEDTKVTDLAPPRMANQNIKIQVTDYELACLIYTQERQILREKMFELLPIHDVPELQDTDDIKCYPYANCVVEVTENGVKFIKYEDLDGCFVWKHDIIKQSLPLSEDYKNVIRL